MNTSSNLVVQIPNLLTMLLLAATMVYAHLKRHEIGERKSYLAGGGAALLLFNRLIVLAWLGVGGMVQTGSGAGILVAVVLLNLMILAGLVLLVAAIFLPSKASGAFEVDQPNV